MSVQIIFLGLILCGACQGGLITEYDEIKASSNNTMGKSPSVESRLKLAEDGLNSDENTNQSSFKTTLGLANTPPMGWNAWNRYACGANETLIQSNADALISTGLASVGYTYLNLDDCWQSGRDAKTNKIIPDQAKFPSGMAHLSAYVHNKGLKFGIYSSAGTKTCEGRPGSLGYEETDAESYAEWGVDYVKYDNCYNENMIFRDGSIKRYLAMAKAIKKTNRPMVYSICNWGQSKAWLWAPEMSQLWRTTADIGNSWDNFNHRCSPCYDSTDPSTCFYFGNSCSILNILDKQVHLTKYARVGGWNDMDMLQIGNGGLTHDQEVAHFSLWAALKSPLIISTDLLNISKQSLDILMNEDVIAINQDGLGKSASLLRREYTSGILGLNKKIKFDVWGGPLSGNRHVVILLNRRPKAETIEFSLSGDLKLLSASYQVYDVWSKQDFGFARTTFVANNVPANGVRMFILSLA